MVTMSVNSKKEYIGVSLVGITEDARGRVTFTAINEETGHEPQESLWQDDFESSVIEGWTQETLTGSGSWTLRNELSSGGQNGCLVLQSAVSSSTLKRDPLVVRLQSEMIHVNADCDSLQLELEFMHTHKLYQKADYITLQVMNSANELVDSLQVSLVEDCDWSELKMRFGYIDKLRLLIECDIDVRSKLGIDNVSLSTSGDIHSRIESPSPVSDVFQINGDDYVIPHGSVIYNVLGTQLYAVDTDATRRLSLPSGLYIVSDGHRSFKIVVR